MDIGWGGLPFIYPSNLCMKYLHHMKVIPEDEIPVGSHYRARTDMMDNVRGYRMVKDGLRRRITDLEREQRRAQSLGCDRATLVRGPGTDQISTSGVSASYLSGGHEHWAPMDPIFYHEKSCSFRNTYTRCPIFKSRTKIGMTEPRYEEFMGMVDIRKKLCKNPSEKWICHGNTITSKVKKIFEKEAQ